MVTEPLHDFFVASASAAGALIGLLFVALSIWQGRDIERPQAEAHRLRASAALTVFTNALVISLFALLPNDSLGETTLIVAIIGAVAVVASATRLLRLRREGVSNGPRDLVFIAGLTGLFAWQLITAIRLLMHPHDAAIVDDIGVIVVISFTYGIGRCWELIGGPQVGIISEVGQLLRDPHARGESAEVPGAGNAAERPAPSGDAGAAS